MGEYIFKPTKRYRDLSELVRDTARLYGDRDAFRWKWKKQFLSRTYNDVLADSMAFSNALQALGLIGEHIGVIGATSYPWIITYLGAVNSSSVIVPVDKELSGADISELLNRADVSSLVYDRNLYDRIDEIKSKCRNIRLYIDMDAEDNNEGAYSFNKLLQDNQGDFSSDIDPEKMCSILFTSGTTGKSKGVMLSHKSLSDNATCMDMGEADGTVSLSVLPIHHAYCFTCDVLCCMCGGVTVCFNDSMMRIAKNIAIFRPHIMLLVPMIIESLNYKLGELSSMYPETPKSELAKRIFGERLHTIYSGGAYLSPKLIDDFAQYGINLVQGYGMTEFSPRISANTRQCGKKNSVGHIIPNCEAKVVDGEICVKGDSMMLGYYKNEEETAKTICDGWLKTGDLGYIDDDGFLFITGRRKNLIILANGENVSPEELENKFSGWQLAKELMVYSDGNTIVLEVYPNSDVLEQLGITDVEAAVKAKVDEINLELPLYKRIVKTVVRSSEFEKTGSGKIKRKR